MKYRIEIDRSLCSGFGACAELAPEVFELAHDGIAAIRSGESNDPDVLEARARARWARSPSSKSWRRRHRCREW